jgi:hypothetical protein
MRFKKALRLSVTNLPLILKTIFTQLIIMSIILAVFALCVSGVVNKAIALFNELQFKENINMILENFAAFFAGDEAFDNDKMYNDIMNLVLSLRDAVDQIQGLFVSFGWAALFLILGIGAYRYFIAFTDIPATMHLTEFMQTSNGRPYIWYFFKNFGKTIKFSFWQMISTFWLDALVLFGVLGVYIVLLAPLKIFGIIIAVLFLIFAYSARQTMFTFWLPQMTVNDQGIRESLRISFQKVIRVFWSVFWKVAVIISISTFATLIINYFTQDLTKLNWVSAFITAALNLYSFLLIKCVGAVEYFEQEEKPYFVKKVKIPLTSETKL